MNHEYFSVIDTQEKAYWLGFMFADGNLGQRASGAKIVNLVQKDRAVLDSFQAALSSPYVVRQARKFDPRYEKEYFWHVTNIQSERLFDDLVSHGCVRAKSNILRPPIGVPNELVSHFIRGYNDGDGGIYGATANNPARIRMRGTTEFLTWVAEQMPGRCTVHPKGPTAQLFSSAKESVIENLKYLYLDAIQCVRSKQLVAMEILKHV